MAVGRKGVTKASLRHWQLGAPHLGNVDGYPRHLQIPFEGGRGPRGGRYGNQIGVHSVGESRVCLSVIKYDHRRETVVPDILGGHI